MGNARKDRGRRTELVAAQYYRSHLWPDCQAVAPSAPGRDLLRTPGAAIEVKARSAFSPVEWARQAKRNAGEDIPIVLMRPVGFGEESVGDWLTFMPNRYFVEMWKEAYGGRGSRRATRRAARQKGKKNPGHSYRLRLGSPPDHPGIPVLEGAVSSILYAMGFEPGDYEMEIRRISGGPSTAGV